MREKTIHCGSFIAFHQKRAIETKLFFRTETPRDTQVLILFFSPLASQKGKRTCVNDAPFLLVLMFFLPQRKTKQAIQSPFPFCSTLVPGLFSGVSRGRFGLDGLSISLSSSVQMAAKTAALIIGLWSFLVLASFLPRQENASQAIALIKAPDDANSCMPIACSGKREIKAQRETRNTNTR